MRTYMCDICKTECKEGNIIGGNDNRFRDVHTMQIYFEGRDKSLDLCGICMQRITKLIGDLYDAKEKK